MHVYCAAMAPRRRQTLAAAAAAAETDKAAAVAAALATADTNKASAVAAAVAAAVATAETDKAAALAAAETDKAAAMDAAAEKLASLEVKYDTVVAKNQKLINDETKRERCDIVCTVMKERFTMKHVSCSSEARSPILSRLGF